mgnify:CR=1 FL=1
MKIGLVFCCMKESKNGFWVSWNGNLKHSFNSLLEVTNEKELSSIIEGSDSVRFFGNKQSSSDIAAGKSTLIDMRKMNKVLLVDTANKRITIQAGAPLELLIKIAEENNWCIPCLPDINTITIGGAIATGTHGTNGKLLSEYIHSCKMITADGKITLIDENHKLFGAVKVSFGSLGHITLIFGIDETTDISSMVWWVLPSVE